MTGRAAGAVAAAGSARSGAGWAEHLATFPAVLTPIRVGGPDAPLEDVALAFVSEQGAPIRRTAFSETWRPAAVKASLPVGTGFHALRHYYASLLIRHGESVKTVQARLGHATAVETLDTYSHLWPDSEDRTREAVDSVLGAADWTRTVPTSRPQTRRSKT